MATKGSKKLTDKLSGLLGHKETPQDQMRAQQVQQAHNKTREHDMISLLNCINIADPNNKLPLKTIQERGYDQTISQAINKLKVPHFFEQNIQKLDSHIKFAIHALDLAIKEGYETTAESANVALCDFFSCLYNNLAYAENLKILINASREFDDLTRDIARQSKRLAAKKADLAEKRVAMDATRQTEEGVRAESEIVEYANNPSAMSDAAKHMRDELYAIYRLKEEISLLESDIDVRKLQLEERHEQKKSIYDRLLQLRINSMTASLNEVQEAQVHRSDTPANVDHSPLFDY